MRRLGALFFARALAAFLAVQVADTPLFCSDERPTDAHTNASSHTAAASGELHTTPDSSGGDDACCFCPCHLTFDSERSLALVATTRPTAGPAFLLPAAPAAPPPSLDHPPQNLG